MLYFFLFLLNLHCFAESTKSKNVIGKGLCVDTDYQLLGIEHDIVKIDERAFEGCERLLDVGFDEDSQVKEIGDYAFKRCVKLTSITLPKSVEKINFAKVFEGCSLLKEIHFEEGGLFQWENGLILTHENQTVVFQLRKDMERVILSSTVRTIEDKAFSGSYVKKIHYPHGIP